MGKSDRDVSGLVVGIDDANLRRGGGFTHLVELLRAAEPQKHGISKVVLWRGSKTVAAPDNRPWLMKVEIPQLNRELSTGAQ